MTECQVRTPNESYDGGSAARCGTGRRLRIWNGSWETQSMWTPSLLCIFWSTVVIQTISVGTIIALQLFRHGRGRRLCQRVFFGLMMAMGLVTLLAVSSASDSWMTSGATLSIMTVCATYDLGASGREAATF